MNRPQLGTAQRLTVRTGFTLVELLVAITIFVILASLTLGSFNAATDGDKGPATIQSYRAWIEGAKSRAARLGRPVGIQPIIDTSVVNGHAVNQFQYVATVEPIQGTLQTSVNTVFVVNATHPFSELGATFDGLFFDSDAGAWLVRQSPADPVLWSAIDGLNPDGTENALEPKLLRPGQRIEIPADSGNWYYISVADPRTAGMGTNPGTFNPSHDAGSGPMNGFYIVGAIDSAKPTARLGGSSTGARSVPPAAASGQSVYVSGSFLPGLTAADLTYRLELGADVINGDRVLTLPTGMFLDLDASSTPTSAHPAVFSDPYNIVPLMVSPTGELIGDFGGIGPLTFYFCSREELAASRAIATHPAASAAAYLAWTRTIAGIPIRSAPLGDAAALTVLPNTGFVQTTLINPTDAGPNNFDGTAPTGGPDGFADNPYQFRLRGELDQ